VKSEGVTVRTKANWPNPAAGTFESAPQGPLDATKQLQHLAQVSSRHNGGMPPSISVAGPSACLFFLPYGVASPGFFAIAATNVST
jgi:hypothetical protein